MAKTLQIVTHAYRCLVEEQDDPTVWISRNMLGLGTELDVLLRGNAVNYATSGQNGAGLSFGGVEQSNPVDMAGEIKGLLEGGAAVYAVSCDMQERGVEAGDLIDGVKTIGRDGLAELFDGYDQVWSW
jgi:sulfur relay (sulfurtransferase) DsrF/TusC family protein